MTGKGFTGVSELLFQLIFIPMSAGVGGCHGAVGVRGSGVSSAQSTRPEMLLPRRGAVV
jgi:hypothetical protein